MLRVFYTIDWCGWDRKKGAIVSEKSFTTSKDYLDREKSAVFCAGPLKKYTLYAKNIETVSKIETVKNIETV